MPRQKGSANRSAKKGAAKHNVPYNMVVFYVIIGLIMGMAIGALALLYIARMQNQYLQSLNSTQGQLLQSYQLR